VIANGKEVRIERLVIGGWVVDEAPAACLKTVGRRLTVYLIDAGLKEAAKAEFKTGQLPQR
jgi:hypothetical protein